MPDTYFSDTTIEWPPEYRVRRNKQAKHVVIRPTNKRTLVITIPHRFAEKHVPKIIDESREWILNQFQRMPTPCFEIPKSIRLRREEVWYVKQIDVGSRPRLYENLSNEIVLLGKKDVSQQLHLLRAWVLKKAKSYLQKQIELISRETRLDFQKLSVRMKRTQWGSCSERKEISLNAKLIFLPECLINHIIIHELAHTVHHNHSKKFWQLVACHDACWEKHRAELKQADCHMPAWLED